MKPSELKFRFQMSIHQMPDVNASEPLLHRVGAKVGKQASNCGRCRPHRGRLPCISASRRCMMTWRLPRAGTIRRREHSRCAAAQPATRHLDHSLFVKPGLKSNERLKLNYRRHRHALCATVKLAICGRGSGSGFGTSRTPRVHRGAL